jgi:choline dehydrogenase-like flavoprotein
VTLSEQVDALGLPKPVLDWKMSDLDSHSRDSALKFLAEEFGSIGLGRVHLTDLSVYGDESLPYKAAAGPTVFGAWHYMGTTRMHADPRKGVVDANCRVHGLNNLYIAGPSVFPTGSFANPVMTIVALTLRLADHLR